MGIKVTVWERIGGATVALILLAGALAFTFAVAHRAGRGATCFEVAVNTRDSTGRSLRSILMHRPGAESDYTFWASHCTISLYVVERGENIGHWRFVLDNATLSADDDDAMKIFPAAGRWQP